MTARTWFCKESKHYSMPAWLQYSMINHPSSYHCTAWWQLGITNSEGFCCVTICQLIIEQQWGLAFVSLQSGVVFPMQSRCVHSRGLKHLQSVEYSSGSGLCPAQARLLAHCLHGRAVLLTGDFKPL